MDKVRLKFSLALRSQVIDPQREAFPVIRDAGCLREQKIPARDSKQPLNWHSQYKLNPLMMNTTQERRRMRRFDMHLPALIRMAQSSQASKTLQHAIHGDSKTQELSAQNPEVHEFWTETQNVSARGIFFYLDRTLAEGSQLEITMTFPPHITMSGSVRVKFAARVIRVESPLPVSRTGIAAVIEDYEFLKAIAPGQIDFQKNDFQKNDFQKN